MKILLVGSGGREHALAWKMSGSRLVRKIYCAPGNAGIAQLAECVDIKSDDIQGLLDFALRQKIDLTVVGPEIPLAAGIVDKFRAQGLDIFGPDAKAAQLEASKVFSKQFMSRHGIPTAAFEVFSDPDQADEYLRTLNRPCVIKADGLAAGKGVILPDDLQDGLAAVDAIMRRKVFGEAGKRIVIEDRLKGREVSVLVLTDTKHIVPLASSQDHKRVFDADKGPNTGGMGAYSPAAFFTPELQDEIMRLVFRPALEGFVKEGIDYRGVLYAGIMLTDSGPSVLEFNVRFGDPETQVILPRLKDDIVHVMLEVSRGSLSYIRNLSWFERSCVCVVLTSGGYPGEYSKGREINGLEQISNEEGVMVFHSGTKYPSGEKALPGQKFLTDGGRVLGISALGYGVKDAAERAYRAAEKINFEGMHYRNDIAASAA